ncbi:MAG: hypothetical protein IM606_09820 [Cytophagales bacterium]|jgi:hypothetical protein|nr:hypothetical protein [Cytophagales bacterium]
MTKQRITFRMLLWMGIGYIALPFAVVLLVAFWLQDLVAGANKHLWRGMARERITFRMLLWIGIGMAAVPFAAVLLVAFWLQDLVAGANKHLWRGKSNADTTDPR